MPIHLLTETVAARIAAGEVVERPASVIKELVENSLDAGSTRIEVETRDGGKELIRIRDNGTGIPAGEAALAFRRHSTSKLVTEEDLEHIATLGFRGEALASIASVSRVTCTTRHENEETGTKLRIEGGKIASQTPVGRPQGTEMLIEDLFYNVPARRKFLRGERTERRHIDAFLTRYAIAYPETAFYVVHNGKQVIETVGNGVAREVLLEVYGLDLGESLLEIPEELTADKPIKVRGFAGPTTAHRSDRGYITLIINGRWIQDLPLTYAIIQAYHTLLPVKRYPIAFVMVDMPAEDIDVNVHPAKTEVRFRNADQAFRAIQRAVRATVMEEAPAAASWQLPGQMDNNDTAQTTPAESTRARLAALQPAKQISFPQPPAPDTDLPAVTATMNAQPQPATLASQAAPQMATATTAIQRPPQLPPLRIIGQASTMFIIAEGPDSLYLIDQHAAHERVLYEKMITAWSTGDVPAQPLLEPETITLPPDQAGALEALLPNLPALGLQIEEFGPGTFLVRAIPAPLKNPNIQELLADVASGGEQNSPIREELEEMIIRRICKRAAVKAGQILSREEMEKLVKDLEKTANPRTCPHGRPTIIQLSVEQLARQFGRG